MQNFTFSWKKKDRKKQFNLPEILPKDRSPMPSINKFRSCDFSDEIKNMFDKASVHIPTDDNNQFSESLKSLMEDAWNAGINSVCSKEKCSFNEWYDKIDSCLRPHQVVNNANK